MTALVIDLYHGNVVHDLEAVKASGVRAVIHKCTEGTGFVDDKYKARRKGFLELGLKWGAYHFFHGGANEAQYFLDHAQPDKDTVVALDWEETSSGVSPTAAQARGFLETVITKLGRKAVIYSGNVAKERIQGNDPFFGGHRLWLAQYGRVWSVQQSWNQPWLWQYSETGNVPGVAGFSDVNTIVSGIPNQFILNWTESGPAPAPPPPVGEQGMASWYDDNANADGSPVNNSVDMTAAHKTLPFGTLVKVTRTDNGLHTVVKITDRGPYISGRIIDLRPQPAKALQMINDGVTRVVVEVIRSAKEDL